MDERKPGYLALIPAEVRYDVELAPNAKLLYGEITALAGADGFCWATNDYFAKLYGVEKRTISRLIGTLESRGHIEVEIVRKKGGSGPIDCRKIFIGRRVLAASWGIDKIVHTPRQNCPEGMDKNVQVYKDYLTSKNDTPLPPTVSAQIWDAVCAYVGDDREYLEAFDGFLRNRAAIKKPVKSMRSISRIINHLREVNCREVEIAMLDKATVNNWLDVYALKQDELDRIKSGGRQNQERGAYGWR